MSVASADNTNANPDFYFYLKNMNLYVPIVTWWAKDNQKLLKLLSKGFEILVYWNKYRATSLNKNTANDYRHFLESNYVGVKRLFVLAYLNRNIDVKQLEDIIYQKTIKNYNAMINWKNSHDQATNADVKQYKEIRKLTTAQGENFITGCLLAYYYIKNHYRLIAVDLSRPKKIDADPKASQQLENVDNDYTAIDADGTQTMLILTILEKIKEMRLKFSQLSLTVL